jgi:hypothetical protein
MIRFEMIFVILAGIFLGTLILQENNNTLSTSDDLTLTQAGLDALSVANFYLDKMTSPSLAFDNYLVSNAVAPAANPTTSLSLLGSIGKESGEVYQSSFNDVDDWNGVDTVVVLRNAENADAGQFHVRCAVSYCDSLGKATLVHTWTKLISVSVTDTVMGAGKSNISQMRLQSLNGQKMTVRKSTIVSYFKFL